MKIRLVQTCSACPEQYNAFLGDKQVGYLRLRHGSFSASCPDAGDTIVYRGSPMGDGSFDDDERHYFLSHAVHAIQHWIKTGESLEHPPAPEVEYTIEGFQDPW